MAAENQVLHADIVAEDHASAELRKVKAELDAMRHKLHEVNHEAHEAGLSFALLAERSEVLRDHFGEVGEIFGETNERLSDMIPAFELLGAAMSVGALVDLTREAAEARTQMSAMAEEIGITTEALEGLRLAARETDVPIESMQTGMVKLQRVMVDAASGKNKQAAEIFARMGISLRDSHGHMRNVNDVLPLVAESLKRTEDTTLRNAVAMQLFGRSGAELIPFLKLGKEGLERLSQTSERLSAHFSREDTENVEAYKNSWIELDAAFEGLKDTITADLAPILTPIVDDMRDWISANRDWLGNSIKDDVHALVADVRELHLGTFIHDLEELKKYADPVAKMAGGWHRIAEAVVVIAAARFAWSVTAPVRALAVIAKDVGLLAIKINKDLVGAWRASGVAATEAAEATEAATLVGGGKAAGAAGKTAAKTAAVEGEEAAEVALKSAGSKAFLRGLVAEGLAGAGGMALEGAAGLAGLALGGAELAAVGGIIYGLLHLPKWLNDLATSFGPTHPALSNAGRGGAAHVADPAHDGSRHYGRGWTQNAYIAPPAASAAAASSMPSTAAETAAASVPAPVSFDIRVPAPLPPLPKLDIPKKIELHGPDSIEAPDDDAAAGASPGERSMMDPARSEITVKIQFANAPPGTTATMEVTGAARAGSIDFEYDYGQNYPHGGY
ncbi:phage tail tape measure protein [Acetobacteraceae bacterium KSS8]|uniref:Phage tail tape measure protein n=1 Tax=Endosaccharibacter trunci TaxID=2812733 RepID=A0ABT1WAJ9_9PROT|nr:phage tail tape measure protein [Acetobacteraceae bacterium KSS8]